MTGGFLDRERIVWEVRRDGEDRVVVCPVGIDGEPGPPVPLDPWAWGVVEEIAKEFGL